MPVDWAATAYLRNEMKELWNMMQNRMKGMCAIFIYFKGRVVLLYVVIQIFGEIDIVISLRIRGRPLALTEVSGKYLFFLQGGI